MNGWSGLYFISQIKKIFDYINFFRKDLYFVDSAILCYKCDGILRVYFLADRWRESNE